MKRIYLIFTLAILALFSSCEAFDDTTYQIYYDSYSQSNSVKRIELREFNEKEGNFENQRTIQLKKVINLRFIVLILTSLMWKY